MENNLTPKEYFDLLKDKKKTITDNDLLQIYNNCLTLIEKYKITGQIKGIRKLIFHLETIEKELEIVRMGVDTFIYKDDIEEYIDNIANDTVKIIELENYERDIPNEVIEVISKVKDKFDQLYVLFTDYTGRIEKQVQAERREKDPILFGTFQNKTSKTIIDRFYFLGDWVDEYCDLTLDKMVNEIEIKEGKNIIRNIKTPKDIQELKEQLYQLEEKNGRMIMNNIPKQKKNFFSKIRTIFRVSKNER